MPAADDGAVLARFRYTFAANRVQEAAAALQQTLKAGFRPGQPRVPAGRPDGGQWTDEDFSGSLIYVQSRRRGSRGDRYRYIVNLGEEKRRAESVIQFAGMSARATRNCSKP